MIDSEVKNLILECEDITPGEERKFECPVCNDGSGKEKLYMTRTDEGVIYHCFKQCGTNGFYKLNELTMKQKLNRYKPLPKEVSLPSDYTLDLPLEVKVKFLPYGLRDRILKDYGIGYSAYLQSVVYPLYDVRGKMTGIQYRRVVDSPDYPKYVTRGDKPIYYCHNLGSDTCVLTEDVLSAIKTSEYASSMCLLGTSLSDEALMFLIKQKFKRLVIWLDNDKAGITAANKITKQLSLYHKNVLTIFSDRDPKDARHDEIKQLLKES